TSHDALGADGMAGEYHAEIELGKDGPELVVTVVNVSPEELAGWDTNLYEVSLEVDVGATERFTLDNLPDSFRYDRTVAAYGVNGGVEPVSDKVFRTTDVATHDQSRPRYWDEDAGPMPNVRFATLAADPLPPLRALLTAAERWGATHWSVAVLDERSAEEEWDAGMREQARDEAELFADELARLQG